MHSSLVLRWPATVLVALVAFPIAGIAQEAFTRTAVNVRAGPDRTYPLVAQLPPNEPVHLMGCLDDWSWCDVAFADSRGWVYGPNLSYVYEADRVPLYAYGPSLGIPIVGFSIGVYWDQYYRGRPWYSGRDEWVHRAPPPHQRPSGITQYTTPPHASPGRQSGSVQGGGQQVHAQAPVNAPHAAPQGSPGRGESKGSSPPPQRTEASHAQAQRPAPQGGPARVEAARAEAKGSPARVEAARAEPKGSPQRAEPQENRGKEGGREKTGEEHSSEERH